MMGDAMLLRAPLLSLVLSLGKLHLLYGIPLIPVRESLVLLRGSSAWQHSGKTPMHLRKKTILHALQKSRT